MLCLLALLHLVGAATLHAPAAAVPATSRDPYTDSLTLSEMSERFRAQLADSAASEATALQRSALGSRADGLKLDRVRRVGDSRRQHPRQGLVGGRIPRQHRHAFFSPSRWTMQVFSMTLARTPL